MMMDDDAVSIISRQLTAVCILCGVPTRQNVVCCDFVFMTMRFFLFCMHYALNGAES